MMKIKLITSLFILLLSLGSFAQVGPFNNMSNNSPKTKYRFQNSLSANPFTGLGKGNSNGALLNYKVPTRFKSINPECDENYTTPLACGYLPEFNSQLKDITKIGTNVFSATEMGCYNKRTDKCSRDPDIKAICACIHISNNEPPKSPRGVAANFNFISGANGSQGLIQGTKKAFESYFKLFTENGCSDSSKLSPEKQAECAKYLDQMEGYKSQMKEFQHEKSRIASSGQKTDDQALMGVQIPEVAKKYNGCFSYNNFMPNSEVPTQDGINFIHYQGKMNTQATSNELDARDFILKRVLSGQQISLSLDYKDAPEEIKPAIKEMINKESVLYSLNSLRIYVAQNPYWKTILEKDPEHGLNDFTKIFESNDPDKIRAEVNKIKNRPDVKQMIADEANRKTQVMKSVFNPDGSLKAINSASFYTNYQLLNKKFTYEGKATPFMCNYLTMGLNGQAEVSSGSVTYQEKLIGDCQNTYKEICGGAAENFSNYKTDDDLKNEENAGLALDYMQNDKLLESEKLAAYLKSAESICGGEHMLDSKHGGIKMSRAAFKRSVCDGKAVKGKIKFSFKTEDEKLKACGDDPQSESILTSYYVKSLNEDERKKIDTSTMVSFSNLTDIESREESEKVQEFIANAATGGFEDDGDDSLFGALANYAKNRSSKPYSVANSPAVSPQGGTADIMGQISSSLNKAATTISSPVVDNNVQNFMQGNLPVNNIYPADFNNTDPAQVNAAKSSVDKGISQIEQRLDGYEKSKVSASDAKKDEEIALLRKQLEELKGQSDLLKAQLEKGADNKVASKGDENSPSVSRSPSSVDYKGVAPQVSSATQSGLGAQSVQPSKVFDNLYGDSSFHSVPTINGSKAIDSKAFTARSSNDALLSIYTDKSVSGLVDAVASSSNSNILVVGNALEMQESTIKSKHFQTKEIVVDQKSLDQVRSNPDILRNLIEENKMNNHVGILTLKTGESQLNYIMRKDDAGKLVILPLNIARKVTLDNLKNELITN